MRPCYDRRRVLAAPAAFWLPLLLALQAPAAPPAGGRGEQTILWFRSADAATVDERALLDAVAVYTRDLGVAVRPAPEPLPVPAETSATAAAAAALRAQGARLGFWCETRPGAALAVLTVVALDGHLELHLVERTAAPEAELYRAIGLKLRSVLAGTATPEPAPAPRAPPPPAAAAPAPPVPAPAPADAGVRFGAATPAPASRAAFASLGYRFSTPFQGAAPRHALAIEGALEIGRRLELAVASEVAPRFEQQVATDTLAVFDWPLIAGARIVGGRGSRVVFGGGVFAALHLRWASASGMDAGVAQSGSSFAAGVGIGAEGLARFRLTAALAGEVRVYAEQPVPTTRYTLRGAEALELGPRAGAGVGLVYAFGSPRISAP
jgi:hypothetical protein